jgi:hypothetical protein
MSYWTLTKKARLRMGWGVDNQCNNCTTNYKALAISCIGDSIQSPIRCITSGQTNEFVGVLTGTTHNRYSFTSGVWDAKDWQSTTLQSFNNQGKKQVGAYNCYQESGCSSGITTSVYFSIPVIEPISFVDNNDTTASFRIKGTNQSKYKITSIIKLFREVNGAWVEIAASNVIPINTQSNLPNIYFADATQTFTSADSSVPIHYKSSSIPLETIKYEDMLTFPLTVSTYKIAATTYTPLTTITAANLPALATALNADLAARGTLPTYVKDSKFFANGTNLILSNTLYLGNLNAYNLVSNVPDTYAAIANLKTSNDTETWADMWVEALYTNTEKKYEPSKDSELVKYSTQFCKLTNYKCIGRFNDIPLIKNQSDAQLVKILATNDTFFTSLLS